MMIFTLYPKVLPFLVMVRLVIFPFHIFTQNLFEVILSQIYKNNSGGSGSGIITIDGDSGSITGSTVTIYADNAAKVAGGTVKFVNLGTVSTLELSGFNGDTFLGNGAGALSTIGGSNTSVGYQSMGSVSTANGNIAFGFKALFDGTIIFNNTAIGTSALESLISGSNNIALGLLAGINYQTNESNNIVIGNNGVIGESNVIRLGTPASSSGQTQCFIAGITGNTVSNQEFVTINSSTGQLGVTSNVGSPVYFQAYLTVSQGVSGNSTSSTIIFNDALTNVGGGYNTSTGIFTAPTTGFYSFSATIYFDFLDSLSGNSEVILSYTGNSQSLRLIQQGSGSYSGTSPKYIILTPSFAIPMTAGDTIQLQPFADGSGTFEIFGEGPSNTPFNTSSMFSGYKVA